MTYEYTITELDSVPSTAITQNGKEFSFFYDTELVDLTQKQTVTITATSSSVYGDENEAKVATTSFDLTFRDACLYDSLITLTPTGQTVQLVNNYDG